MSESIENSSPGRYDSSQPGRLLRHTGSKLSFASFHPGTASAWRESLPDINKLSLNEELYRPKRVVIETGPDGQSTWRFVPTAKRESGVQNEGAWPRNVDLCGEIVEFDQDLWDIYKLDPEYTCTVRAPPALTTIVRDKGKGRAPETESDKLPPNATGSKRRYATLSPERQAPPMTPSSKRPRRKEVLEDPESDWDSSDDELGSSNEEDEVEGMIIDGATPQPKANERTRTVGSKLRDKLRELKEANRTSRREKLARRFQNGAAEWERKDGEMIDLTGEDEVLPTSQPPYTRKPECVKRKVSSDFTSSQTPDGTSNVSVDGDQLPRSFKRARTVSPTRNKRDLAGKKNARERKLRKDVRGTSTAAKQHRHGPPVDDVLPDVPEENDISLNGTDVEGKPSPQTHADPSQPEVDDEEQARLAAIEESRRKLADLEKDRPLWEKARRERERQERAEKEAAERERRLQEQAARAARERKEQEKKEQERRESLARESAARREKDEREKRKRQQWERWSRGVWTSQRALERYKLLSEAFDNTKFSKDEEPLTFEAVPWPVLHSPITFKVEDVEWSAVEKFFIEVKHHMRTQDYKVFVEKSHRRFHPDRWRSRRLFDAIPHEQERGELEVAANTVAQALTPIWREVKGR